MEAGDFLSHQILSTFFPFFLLQPLSRCKYFNFAANKLSPKGMNLFLMLSRHVKQSNFVRIQMLCMQGGQNMNLFIGCCVFYGLDSIVQEQGPARPMMRPMATFSFLIFFNDFSFFLYPRPSFLLAPPSSSSLLPPHPSFPRPALSESFRFRKSPFFINFDESITDGPTDRRTNGPTDRPTDQPTDKASYRDADASKNSRSVVRQ